MIFSFRNNRIKDFLLVLLALVFLCVSFWQSSHVHHQHGSADAEFVFWPISFVSGLSEGHHGGAESHGEHNHDAPDKTAHLYKHKIGWNSLRSKANGNSTLKMPAVICTWDIANPTSEAGTIKIPYVMGASSAWINALPPARASPFTAPLV